MPVQVSYKKQLALMLMLLITLLVVIEIIVNFWLYNFYRCDFEDKGIFRDVDEETKRKICLESIGLDFTKQNLKPQIGTGHKQIGGIDDTIVHVNSKGFRGKDYSIEKAENTYRIFVMGGSTVFGAGVLDNQTFPWYLQKNFNNNDLGINVEVINAGWVGWWSQKEVQLIKEKLLQEEPDLFIVYDGWNELMRQFLDNPDASPILWKERWKEICELGNVYGYDTIITLQPTAGTGKRILTEQEHSALLQNKNENDRLVYYPQYFPQLKELRESCTVTADLRGLFDNIQEPIYYDVVHTGSKGNQIIAEKFYKLSLPLILKKIDSSDSDEEFQEIIAVPNNVKLSSNEYDNFYEEISNTARQLIFPYKTPRIIPLIFPQ